MKPSSCCIAKYLFSNEYEKNLNITIWNMVFDQLHFPPMVVQISLRHGSKLHQFIILVNSPFLMLVSA